MTIKVEINNKIKDIQKKMKCIPNGISPGKIIAYENIISSLDSIMTEIGYISSGYSDTNEYASNSEKISDLNTKITTAWLIQVINGI